MLWFVFRAWIKDNCLVFVCVQFKRPEEDKVITETKSIVYAGVKFVILGAGGHAYLS
jgi:hypothetical protein